MKKFFTLFALAVMAFAAQANVLTVCEGEATNDRAPLYGLYMDTQNTMVQMIYPADMLTDMVDGKISQVKFFCSDDAGIATGLSGAVVQLSVKAVEQDYFNAEALEAVEGTTAVATTTIAGGENELVFDFNEPFEYTGGNLLIETLVTTPAGFKTVKFYGVDTENPSSMYQYVWATWTGPSVNALNFLPQAGFTFEAGTTPEPTYTPVAPKVTIATNDADVVVEGIIEGGAADYGTVTLYQVDKEGVRHEIENPESFTRESEDYIVTIVAVATYENGEVMESEPVQVTVSKKQEKPTSIDEMNAGKTVAGVRYFNMAGQEMQEANGICISVYTFTDGTQVAVKVMQ